MNIARYIEPADRVKAAELRVAMGDFVHSLGPWDDIAHLTFKWEVSIWSAQRCYEKFMRTEVRGVSTFYAIEANPSRDGHHVHAVWRDCRNLFRKDKWRIWFDRYGRNLIEPVRSEQDVTDYVAKYVTKQDAWWGVKMLEHRMPAFKDFKLVME